MCLFHPPCRHSKCILLSSTPLIPTLSKLLFFQLQDLFPSCEDIYSTSGSPEGKGWVLDRIREKYTLPFSPSRPPSASSTPHPTSPSSTHNFPVSNSTRPDYYQPRFTVIGDGQEECDAAIERGMRAFCIQSAHDLEDLYWDTFLNFC